MAEKASDFAGAIHLGGSDHYWALFPGDTLLSEPVPPLPYRGDKVENPNAESPPPDYVWHPTAEEKMAFEDLISTISLYGLHMARPPLNMSAREIQLERQSIIQAAVNLASVQQYQQVYTHEQLPALIAENTVHLQRDIDHLNEMRLQYEASHVRRMANRESVIDNLRGQLTAREGEAAELKRQISSDARVKGDLHRALLDAESKIRDLQRWLEARDEDLLASHSRRAELTRRLNEAQDKIRELEADLASWTDLGKHDADLIELLTRVVQRGSRG
jgi:hypothetical protein